VAVHRSSCGPDAMSGVQVAQSLHFMGIGAQDLAADFHRLWKYEDTASAHVTLPPSAQQVRILTAFLPFFPNS
jgi:hypothetical protein